MTTQGLSLLLVAVALVVAPGPAGPRSRLRQPGGPSAAPRADSEPARWLGPVAGLACGAAAVVLIGGAIGLLIGALAGAGMHLAARRVQRGARPDGDGEPLELAGAWDLLAACLRAGLPVPVAVRAVAEGLGGAAGLGLRHTAELLTLGADPEQAWQPALDCTATARLARVARRSGRSGTALAESLTRLAAEVRAGAREQSEARAQRAGVLIAGPLGLCFLPAFLAIGVVPVVIGLASGLVQQW
ncbi:MAG: type II secretion system F family protein [Pseudonocardiaceae bacterium]